MTGFGSFATEYQDWVEAQVEGRLVSNLRRLIPAGGVVLDAGCGGGSVTAAIAPLCGRVIGIDLEPRMIALARARTTDLDNVSLLVGDLAAPPLAAESVDLVVASYALHQAPVEQAMEQLARVLRPGGWLVLQEPTCPVRG